MSQVPSSSPPASQSDSSPDGVGEARQTEQQPAAHVRGAGAQCRRAAAETAPAEDEIRQICRAPVGVPADDEHEREVGAEGKRNDQTVLFQQIRPFQWVFRPTHPLGARDRMR